MMLRKRRKKVPATEKDQALPKDPQAKMRGKKALQSQDTRTEIETNIEVLKRKTLHQDNLQHLDVIQDLLPETKTGRKKRRKRKKERTEVKRVKIEIKIKTERRKTLSKRIRIKRRKAEKKEIKKRNVKRN